MKDSTTAAASRQETRASGRPDAAGPEFHGRSRARLAVPAGIAVAFGITLLIMNFSIYQAFARIPLGVAVTIEFLGPLGVAVAGSRHLRDVGRVGLAAP